MLKFLIALALLVPNYAYSYECSKKIDELSAEYKISINCKFKSFSKDELRFDFKQASQDLIDKSENAIKSFLNSMNKDLISKKISSINLVYDLKAWGSSISGLSNGKIIFISLDDYSSLNRDRIYLEILHHEFSSNIFKGIDWVKRIEWRDINYAYELSWDYLKKCISDTKFAEATSERILKDGFLKNYSLTNDENDFNVYAELVFTDPKNIKVLKENYPKIKTKLEKFKEFYRQSGFVGKFPDET